MAAPSIISLDGRSKTLGRLGDIVSISGLSVQEDQFGAFNKSIFTFNAVAFTITDALTYLGTKIYDFPEGALCFGPSWANLTPTTTSAISSTLNSGVTVGYGFGTATASAGALTIDMCNVLKGTFTSSTTINVAAAAAFGRPVLGTATIAHDTSVLNVVNGTATAADLFFNLGVPTNTDIDADATMTVTGTAVIIWTNLGDV